MFKTIEVNSSFELIEKKSKFIANVFYVESVQEAEEILSNHKKKYYDAKHNCYAYSIYNNGNIINKSSDDGEPSGTAGAPMLKILLSQGLSNVLVVNTRYFGGILLGTGGLVKAYSDSCVGAIEKSKIISMQEGLEVVIEIDYADLDNLKYYFKNNNINIIKYEYLQNVVINFEITNIQYTEIFNNNLNLNFCIKNKKILKNKYVKI